MNAAMIVDGFVAPAAAAIRKLSAQRWPPAGLGRWLTTENEISAAGSHHHLTGVRLRCLEVN